MEYWEFDFEIRVQRSKSFANTLSDIISYFKGRVSLSLKINRDENLSRSSFHLNKLYICTCFGMILESLLRIVCWNAWTWLAYSTIFSMRAIGSDQSLGTVHSETFSSLFIVVSPHVFLSENTLGRLICGYICIYAYIKVCLPLFGDIGLSFIFIP